MTKVGLPIYQQPKASELHVQHKVHHGAGIKGYGKSSLKLMEPNFRHRRVWAS